MHCGAKKLVDCVFVFWAIHPQMTPMTPITLKFGTMEAVNLTDESPLQTHITVNEIMESTVSKLIT